MNINLKKNLKMILIIFLRKICIFIKKQFSKKMMKKKKKKSGPSFNHSLQTCTFETEKEEKDGYDDDGGI